MKTVEVQGSVPDSWVFSLVTSSAQLAMLVGGKLVRDVVELLAVSVNWHGQVPVANMALECNYMNSPCRGFQPRCSLTARSHFE